MAKVFSIDGNTISYGGFLLRELGNGSLTISKTVSGSGFDPAKTFEITVVFSAPVTYNGTTSTTHTFNLAHGQSVTITDIPELTEYEVTETPLSQQDIEAGYSFVGITGGIGSIGNGQTSVAAAENYHSRLPAKHIRIQFEDANYDPTTEQWQSTVTWTRVSTTPNVWDCENTNTEWRPTNFGNGWGGFGNSAYQVLSMNAEGVTATPFMFAYGTLLAIYDVSRTDSITDMHNMFEGCYALTSVPLFDTRSVTNMKEMFYNCESLTTIPLFDTSSVTTMEGMFGQSAITTVPLLDTSSVTNMKEMFYNCGSLTTVPLLDTSSVTTMQEMFGFCSALTSVALFDTSNVTDMSWMFYGCGNLTSSPLFDTGKVTDMGAMFYSCIRLTQVPLFDTRSVTDVEQMFDGCVAVSGGALALYNRMSSQANPPASHLNCFLECGRNTASGRAELAQIPATWGGDRT